MKKLLLVVLFAIPSAVSAGFGEILSDNKLKNSVQGEPHVVDSRFFEKEPTMTDHVQTTVEAAKQAYDKSLQHLKKFVDTVKLLNNNYQTAVQSQKAVQELQDHGLATL